jgi:maltose O-acetyltransferase
MRCRPGLNRYPARRLRKILLVLGSKLPRTLARLRLKRRSLRIGQGVEVHSSSRCISGNLVVGDRVVLNDAFIDATALVTIGDDAFFGPGVRILTASHDVGLSGRERAKAIRSRPITIGSGAFVASGATILGGTSIGENAVIGAGSLVTGDVPDDCFAAGNPARVVRPLDIATSDT